MDFMRKLSSIRILSLVVLLAGAFALRAEQGHPLIKAYEGSVLAEFKTDAFNEYARVVGNAEGENQVEKLEGRLTRLRYRNPPDRSPLEIVRNYEEALVGQGLTIDYRCSGWRECGNRGIGHKGFSGWQALNGMNFGISPDVRYFTGQLQHEDRRVYVSVGANSTIHYVHLLEVTAMETGKVVVDAAALSSALDRQGRVVVEGIFFDTDSAVLKPESNPALAEVASLLKMRPEIRLHVVGHTDPTGQFDHNLRLSQTRAEAVVASLVEAHRINRVRLRAHGVGPLAPAASNADEAGRSQNRRVEIVLQ